MKNILKNNSNVNAKDFNLKVQAMTSVFLRNVTFVWKYWMNWQWKKDINREILNIFVDVANKSFGQIIIKWLLKVEKVFVISAFRKK